MLKAVMKSDIEALFEASRLDTTKMGRKTTVVCMTLPNGFEIVETSSCVDPDNYNHEIGVDICTSRLKDRLWLLEGYRLQCALADEGRVGTFLDRLAGEKRDLAAKIERLAVFVESPVFHSLSAGERERLSVQLGVMRQYEAILADRLAVLGHPAT